MDWKGRSIPDSLIFATPKNNFLLEDRVCRLLQMKRKLFSFCFFSRDKEVLKNYEMVGCRESTLTSKATPLVKVKSHYQWTKASRQKRSIFNFVPFLGSFKDSGSFLLPCVQRINLFALVAEMKNQKKCLVEVVMKWKYFSPPSLCLPPLPSDQPEMNQFQFISFWERIGAFQTQM